MLNVNIIPDHEKVTPGEMLKRRPKLSPQGWQGELTPVPAGQSVKWRLEPVGGGGGGDTPDRFNENESR
jgi:hypothetical protein